MRLNNFYYTTPWADFTGEFKVNWDLVEKVTAPKDLPMEVKMCNKLTVHKVIFHYPATIVIWKDGTKTVVKCGPDDEYDPEKGVALCFMKKALGNKGNYNNILRDALKSYQPAYDISLDHPAPGVTRLSGLCEVMADAFRKSLGFEGN